MPGLNADILKPGLKALYYSGAHRVLAPFSRGVGLIYMLHRVSPHRQSGFAPNRGLTVTPDYLASVLAETRQAGLDIVSLDEARRRLRDGDCNTRFACFTLDDGYRDNLEHAHPIFAAHDAPFTVYIPSEYPDGRGELWWVALEEIIAAGSSIEIAAANGSAVLPIITDAEKYGAFDHIYRNLRNMDQDAQRTEISALCARHGFDMAALCRKLIMTWDEVRQLAADPLVTIGAHTAGHYALAALPEARAREEMKSGADRIAEELGVWPEHLSYPYGDPNSAGPREFRIAAELGFKTAVTTRRGVVFQEHSEYLTALPRVSLNGEFQSSLYTRLFMSGAPFALWNRFRRVDAA